MSVFGFCNNKCKHEVYTKEETENNFFSKTIVVNKTDEDLNNYTKEGRYYFPSAYTPKNIPNGTNGWLEVFYTDGNSIKQIWYRCGTAGDNDYETYIRTYAKSQWGSWAKVITSGDYAVLMGTITLEATGGSTNVNYPSGFTAENCIVIACGITYNSNGYRAFGTVQANVSTGARLNPNSITVSCYPIQDTSSPTGTFDYRLVLMKLPYVDISNFEKGDVNMDGKVTLEDYLLAGAYVSGTETFTDKQFKLADMDNDGIVTTADANAIKTKAENATV